MELEGGSEAAWQCKEDQVDNEEKKVVSNKLLILSRNNKAVSPLEGGETMVRRTQKRPYPEAEEINVTNKTRTTGDQGVYKPSETVRENVSTNLVFQKGDKAPYMIHLQRISDEEGKYSPLLTLQLCKLLERAGIKFKTIDPVSKKNWNVFFESMDAANRALSNDMLKDMKLRATLPVHHITCKGKIGGIPLEMSVQELCKKISEENSVKATDGFRLKRRIKKDTGEVEWQDTYSVVLTFRCRNRPEKVHVDRTILYTSVYVLQIRQCFKCGQVGHSKKFCKNIEKCLICNEERHPEGVKCSKSPKCVNCSGPHRSLDKNCTKIIKAREINEVMANNNVSFFEAKKIVGIKKAPSVRVDNFPSLKTGRDDQNQTAQVKSNGQKSAWDKPMQFQPENKSQDSRKNTIKVDNMTELITLPADMVRLLQELPKIPEVEKMWQRIWTTIRTHMLTTEMDSKQPPSTSKLQEMQSQEIINNVQETTVMDVADNDHTYTSQSNGDTKS